MQWLLSKSLVKIDIKSLNKLNSIKESSDEEDKDSDYESSSEKNKSIYKVVYQGEDQESLLKSVSLLLSNKTRKLSDFKLVKHLGKGGFGAVILAKDNKNKLYAMKRVRKDKLLELDAVSGFIIERNILGKQKHPFLLSLQYAFETDLRYYLFLEYIPGGDIYNHLKRQLNGFSLDIIWFFGCQIILAIEHLHKNGYIHWDIKPENILIDSEGYLKLADFGISKHIDNTQHESGVFGTYEYMAPEIIEGTSFNKKFQLDWWAFGVLLYELRFKKSPFKADSQSEMQKKIIKEDVQFPKMNEPEKEQKIFK